MIKILYAEDDAMQAKTCIDYLKRAGYKDGPAAMENRHCGCIAGKRPALILMDVIMPQDERVRDGQKDSGRGFFDANPVYQFLDTFSTRY